MRDNLWEWPNENACPKNYPNLDKYEIFKTENLQTHILSLIYKTNAMCVKRLGKSKQTGISISNVKKVYFAIKNAMKKRNGR